MKPRLSNARKTMRVATVFTGAAACAAAFTPAATAGTVHQARALPRQDGKKYAPIRNGRIEGSIRSSGACHNAEWVHLEWSRGYTDCFGYAGLFSFGPLKISHECGGTNYGQLDIVGKSPIHYGPGTTYRGFPTGTEASVISILSWHGTDHCGGFPAG
jgi:hypothetical protein